MSAQLWNDPLQRDYYSLSKSAIVCALFFRTDHERMNFCVENDLMPPDRKRQPRLDAWIDEQRAKLASNGKGAS